MTDALKKSLDDFADMLMREGNATASVEIRLDIFKTVSTYYLGCNRVGRSGREKFNGKEEEVTFGELVERLGKATETQESDP